jgi:Fe-S cluster assembly protein SufB
MANSPKFINDEYKYGFKNDDVSFLNTGKGLTEDIVREISALKHEPDWMLQFRLKSYRAFLQNADAEIWTGFKLP